MSIVDLSKIALKYILGLYFCAALSFLIISVGTDRKNYLIDAFSPIKLISEIMAGNSGLINTSIWIFGSFKILSYLIKIKDDNLEDFEQQHWLRTLWNWYK